jgi:hypothetical protein
MKGSTAGFISCVKVPETTLFQENCNLMVVVALAASTRLESGIVKRRDQTDDVEALRAILNGTSRIPLLSIVIVMELFDCDLFRDHEK